MSSLLRQRRFIVRYGQGDHEFEHCVNIEGYPGVTGGGEDIPQAVSDNLNDMLGTQVMNRGSRIEVMIPEHHGQLIVFALEIMGGVHDPEGQFLWE